MEFDHSFTVAAGIDDTWRLLVEPERSGPCLPGAMVEASIGRFAEYGQPLNDADLGRFAEIVQISGRPVIAPSQKKFTAADVPKLRTSGIGAILLGIIVTGSTPDDVFHSVKPIVEAARG